MDIIESTFTPKIPQPQCFKDYTQNINYAILDIETTGISSYNNQIILIGLLYYANNRWLSKQYFAEKIKEEPLILKSFIKDIEQFECVISYNGNKFDIPFINQRLHFHKLNFTIPAYQSFDLYKILTASFYKKILPDLKLKTVEKYMGFNRTDTISGKDSVLLYKEYEASSNQSLKKTILLHNLEDICYLHQTLNILKHLNFEKIIFEQATLFKIDDSLKWYHTKSLFKKNHLHLEGYLKNSLNLRSQELFTPSYDFSFDHNSNHFILKIPFETFCLNDLNLKFIDIQTLNFQYTKKIRHSDFPDHILVFCKSDEINYSETNAFIKTLFKQISHEHLISSIHSKI